MERDLVRYATGALLPALGDGDGVVGRPIRDVLATLVGDPDPVLLAEADPATGHRTLEVGHAVPGGGDRRLEVTVAPVSGGKAGPAGQVVSIRDVTAIRHAEAAADFETRIRASLGLVLQRIPEGAELEEMAQALTEGLVGVAGVDLAMIIAFEDETTLVQLARSSSLGALLPFGAIAPDAAMAIQARALHGPWSVTSGETGARGLLPQFAEYGVKAVSFEPIVHGDHVGGLLAVGTADPDLVSTMQSRMPTVGDLSNTVSVLLAERIHEWRRIRNTRTAIARTIADSAFRSVFQPIVDLETQDVVGYEALTRFESGLRPDQAFREAWEVGLGCELELAATRAAVTAARGLPAGRWLDLNVSPRLLHDPAKLAGILRRADRPVVLEITEHEVISDYKRIREATARIGRDTRLAVDDAGAGIANFTHIVELRADFVKLDMSLVRGINVALGRQALVKGMVHFSRSSGCRLIAEGIETEEEAATLSLLGVEFGQGFLYGRPDAVEAMAASAGSKRGGRERGRD